MKGIKSYLQMKMLNRMAAMNRTFNLGIFSTYRAELMGIATILIIVCHMPCFGVAMPHWASTLLGSCGFGVDMFLFLSGMGIHNSYASNGKKHKSLPYWWIRRYIRIVLPLIVLVVPIGLLGGKWHSRPVYSVLLEISGFGSFFGHSALWFISCILGLYIFTPLLHKLFIARWKWCWLLALSAACYIYAYLPPSSSIFHFMLNRCPIYFLGYALSDSINRKKEEELWLYVYLPLVLYVSLYILNHRFGLHFCLFGLQGVMMVTIFAIFMNKFSSVRLHNFLVFIGAISLESYVTNEYLMRALLKCSWSFNGIFFNIGNWPFYIVGTILCVLVSFIAKELVQRITLKSKSF